MKLLSVIYFAFITSMECNTKRKLLYEIEFKIESNDSSNNKIQVFEGTSEHLLCKESDFITSTVNFKNKMTKTQNQQDGQDNNSSIKIQIDESEITKSEFISIVDLSSNKNCDIESIDFSSIYDLIYSCNFLGISYNYGVKIYRKYFKLIMPEYCDEEKEESLLKDIIESLESLSKVSIADDTWTSLLIGYAMSQGMGIFIEEDKTKIDYLTNSTQNGVDIDTYKKDIILSSNVFKRLSVSRLKIMIQLLNKVNSYDLDLTSWCDLNRNKMDYLKNSVTLKKLNISGNRNIRKLDIDAIFLVENLTELDISWCDLKPDDLKNIYKLKNLKNLNVSWNKNIGKQDIGAICQIKNLVELNIRDCNLQIRDLENIYKLKKLKKLNISGNGNLRKQDIDAIFRTENLVKLDICNCDLQPGDLEDIYKLKNLKKLEVLWNRSIGKQDIDAICRIENLIELDIRNCNLQLGNLENIYKLKNLKKLDVLWNVSIGKQDVDAICRIENLTELDIRGCDLQLGDLENVYKLKNLKKLNISLNKNIGKKDIDLICQIESLVELDISGCYLGQETIQEIRKRGIIIKQDF